MQRASCGLALALLAACSSGPAPRPTSNEAEATTPSDEDRDEAPRGDAEEDTVPSDHAIDPSGTPPAAVTLSEPTGVVEDAQFVGRWAISGSISSAGPPGLPPGSGGGGAIGWTREYELRADHTFQMNAYPSLTLRGTWRRVGTTGARVELVHDDARRPDGSAIVTPVMGLAEAGQPLGFLEIEGQRFPRMVVAP